MFLKESDLEKFSSIEQAVIDIIGKQSITLSDIASIVYKHQKTKPLYPTSVISSAIKRINLKAEMYQLNFRIRYKGGLGRGGRTFSINYIPANKEILPIHYLNDKNFTIVYDSRRQVI